MTTEDGDAIVEPGETATITLSIDMMPNVDVPGGPVLGLSVAVFDTIGDQGAANGNVIDWQILNTLDDLTGDLTELHGIDLIGTTAAQSLITDDPFSHDDPIDVLQFTWGTDDYAAYSVHYSTHTYFIDRDLEHLVTVWEGDLNGDFDDYLWPITEAAISFTVVPAPNAAALIAGVCSLAARRPPRRNGSVARKRGRQPPCHLWQAMNRIINRRREV